MRAVSQFQAAVGAMGVRATLVRAGHELRGLARREVRRVQVQGHLQAEAAVAGGADADPGPDQGVARVELAALRDAQERRLEAGPIADREQLLRVGPGPPWPPMSSGTDS